ncbi:hypothetical protein CA54_38560 [Symmachiella macrocystis]|uniref:Uncharacterized protein n=1 Tax=Symmachiella macrocystis TaxID=2527985 RepID=A0A5C6BAE5_9PLAN|nr:hypothetical protein CA54_38560 [Symmachiella macrocystis]
MPRHNGTCPDPDDFRPELARIFAAAILRLSTRAALSGEISQTNSPTCLEVPPETVLSDHHG